MDMIHVELITHILALFAKLISFLSFQTQGSLSSFDWFLNTALLEVVSLFVLYENFQPLLKPIDIDLIYFISKILTKFLKLILSNEKS